MPLPPHGFVISETTPQTEKSVTTETQQELYSI